MNTATTDCCKDLIEAWYAGQPVDLVELGGMGDDYEHAIQELTVFLVNHLRFNTLPDDEQALEFIFNHAVEAFFACDVWDYGYSGAQVAAAKHAAYMYLSNGYRTALSLVDSDRIISMTWKGEPHA